MIFRPFYYYPNNGKPNDFKVDFWRTENNEKILFLKKKGFTIKMFLFKKICYSSLKSVFLSLFCYIYIKKRVKMFLGQNYGNKIRVVPIKILKYNLEHFKKYFLYIKLLKEILFNELD